MTDQPTADQPTTARLIFERDDCDLDLTDLDLDLIKLALETLAEDSRDYIADHLTDDQSRSIARRDLARAERMINDISDHLPDFD